MKKKKEIKLTGMQEAFAQEFIKDLNATAAAIRAGYSNKGHAAANRGSENLRNPKIVKRIQELQKDRAEAMHITQGKIVEELVNIAFADYTNFGEITETADGKEFNLKNFKELPMEYRRLIQKIKTAPDGTPYVECSDKMKALELLARHLGMFDDRLTLKTENDKPVKIEVNYAEPPEWLEELDAAGEGDADED